MKVFKKSALVLAMTASAGMAHAASSEIDIIDTIDFNTPAGFAVGTETDVVGATGGQDTGAISVEQRIVDAGAIEIDFDSADLGGAADGARSVVYEPAVALADSLTLKFEVTGGEISENNDLALVAFFDADPATNPGGEQYVQVASVNDFEPGDNGWSSVTLQLDLTAADAASADFLNADGQIKEGTTLALVDNTANANPDFIMDQGSSSLSIQMSTATNSSGVSLAAPVSNTELLAQAANNISLAINTVTSTIDVEFEDANGDLQSRRGFEGHNPDPTGSLNADYVSSAEATLDLGNSEVGLDSSTVTSAVLSLSRDNVDGVVGVGIDEDDPNAATFFQDELVDGAYANSYGTDVSALEGGQEIAIVVNGDDVLATGNWTASLSIEPDAILGAAFADANAAVESFTLTETSHIWDINGAQVKIPYHAQETAGFFFFSKIVNESGRDAEVFADVIVTKNPNSDNPTNVTVQDVALGSVPANGSATINQVVIQDAINDAEPGTIVEGEVAHVAMTMTVLAPTDQVQVTAYQKSSNGRTDLPVYFDTANRNWLQ